MTTTITSTGERHKSRQTRSSRQPSSSSARWSEALLQLELSPRSFHIPLSHSGRRTGVASTRGQVAVSGTFQCPRNCRRLSFGVCPYHLALHASLTLRRRVTEQPYKIPFYATLLYQLSIPTNDVNHAAGGEENGPAGFTKPSLGRLILDDFWKGFQAYLDKLAWRETRLCVRSRTASPPLITLTRFPNRFTSLLI